MNERTNMLIQLHTYEKKITGFVLVIFTDKPHSKK